ncbi:MAG: hypothetical protein GX957_01135 [Clostridiaceae bacterium]|nr:hypothetical protein [Clostridiaceae bacterium]
MQGIKKCISVIVIIVAIAIVFLVKTTVIVGATGILNVKDYGAVGNGLVDDRAAIQAAINDAATGLGDGVVYFPAGTYLVKDIVVLKSNITLSLDEYIRYYFSNWNTSIKNQQQFDYYRKYY